MSAVPVLAAAALYAWGKRASDMGAVIRHQIDERQEYARLKVQALVGRALSLAVALGYLVASATKTTLWPWAVLLGVLALSFLVGWLLYGNDGFRRGTDKAV